MPDLNRPERAASIRDVAKAAGVSHQTVSRVLNRAPSIRDETRDRVLAAMAELQYRPNAAARALSTHRSRTIGILVSVSAHYGPALSMQAIEEAARRRDHAVASASVASTDPEVVRDALESLIARDVEGLIVIGPQQGLFDTLDAVAPTLPTVTLCGTEAALHRHAADGARIATRYLIDLGHTRIAHLAGPAGWIESEARVLGFTEQMAERGLPAVDPERGDWTAEHGYRAGLRLLREGTATACFCSNDEIALGFLHAARDAGVDVPGRMSVVGYDDVPAAAHLLPPLTTVRQDFAGLGRRCIEQLFGTAEDTAPGPPALVVRATTAPPY